MTARHILCLIVICLFAGTNPAHASAKKKPKTYIKLIEAYTQRTVSGNDGAPPMMGTLFRIVWLGDKYPEAFFWRGSSGWLNCQMSKAHKVTNKKTKSISYRTDPVTDGNDVHKGDTLELSPITGGRFPIPAEIPASARNTLFFKTNGSNWLSFPVKKLSSKPDLKVKL